eukprot:TRINITY_DN9635_c0_g2_i3.p1 TRINITY_DN9635_c0_g2~~TRINITY_DN9635_c0_g2_i3.p1  ORF type:complete len:566 (+),score=134.41 TRINITY_DN9635_c0_g2_i3:74-1699(+)
MWGGADLGDSDSGSEGTIYVDTGTEYDVGDSGTSSARTPPDWPRHDDAAGSRDGSASEADSWPPATAPHGRPGWGQAAGSSGSDTPETTPWATVRAPQQEHPGADEHQRIEPAARAAAPPPRCPRPAWTAPRSCAARLRRGAAEAAATARRAAARAAACCWAAADGCLLAYQRILLFAAACGDAVARLIDTAEWAYHATAAGLAWLGQELVLLPQATAEVAHTAQEAAEEGLSAAADALAPADDAVAALRCFVEARRLRRGPASRSRSPEGPYMTPQRARRELRRRRPADRPAEAAADPAGGPPPARRSPPQPPPGPTADSPAPPPPPADLAQPPGGGGLVTLRRSESQQTVDTEPAERSGTLHPPSPLRASGTMRRRSAPAAPAASSEREALPAARRGTYPLRLERRRASGSSQSRRSPSLPAPQDRASLGTPPRLQADGTPQPPSPSPAPPPPSPPPPQPAQGEEGASPGRTASTATSSGSGTPGGECGASSSSAERATAEYVLSRHGSWRAQTAPDNGFGWGMVTARGHPTESDLSSD